MQLHSVHLVAEPYKQFQMLHFQVPSPTLGQSLVSQRGGIDWEELLEAVTTKLFSGTKWSVVTKHFIQTSSIFMLANGDLTYIGFSATCVFTNCYRVIVKIGEVLLL